MRPSKTRRVRKGPKAKKVKSAYFTYKQPDNLRRFISETSSIMTRDETGLTQKLQRQLSVAIKRARHLALLPFTQTV